MSAPDLDAWHMSHALGLAERGRGAVEPNPMVGCVITRGAEIIGLGWHQRHGGPHAEIEAIAVAGSRAAGATMYVTLEPCCHHGKTPPCTQAVIAAGIARVVAAMRDPFPAVSGGGLAELAAAGIEVVSGVEEEAARRLNAPYLKLLSAGRPWLIAKWAMTLDGKLATRTGHSQWISGEASRSVAHELRGRVDAIMVGRGTAEADDPLLTARPLGPRQAVRIVVDSRATLASASQLVRTASDAPVLVAAGPAASPADVRRLEMAGCEVLVGSAESPDERLEALLNELGRRRMTNVLVEGGARLLGSCFDRRLVDEVHIFIAPKIAGGAGAASPVGGEGIERMDQALGLEETTWRNLEHDLYLAGRILR